AMFCVELCEVEQCACEIEYARVESKPPQPEQNGGLLHGPHGAAVIAQWVVKRMRRRERSDAPAAEHVRSEQSSNDRPHVIGIDDSGGETMTDIGCDRADKLFSGIHRQREEPFLFDPPVTVE